VDSENHPDDRRLSEDITEGENDFRGVLALGRLLDGFRDLHRNGPGLAYFACLHDISMAAIWAL